MIPGRPGTSVDEPVAVYPIANVVAILELPDFNDDDALPIEGIAPGAPTGRVRRKPFTTITKVDKCKPDDDIGIDVTVEPALGSADRTHGNRPVRQPDHIFATIYANIVDPRGVPDGPYDVFDLPAFLNAHFPTRVVATPSRRPAWRWALRVR